MRRIALVAGLMVASSAHAQTTTSCGWEFGKWVCRSTPAQRPADFSAFRFANPAESFAQGAAMAEQIRQNRAAAAAAQAQAQAVAQATAAAEAAPQKEALRQQVAAAVLEQRCEDAQRIAISELDLALALEAAKACPPSPPAP